MTGGGGGLDDGQTPFDFSEKLARRRQNAEHTKEHVAVNRQSAMTNNAATDGNSRLGCVVIIGDSRRWEEEEHC